MNNNLPIYQRLRRSLSLTFRSGALDGGPRHLAECESLRGVAILLVMLFHAHNQLAATHPLTPNLLSAFIIAGSTGVTLFFVLSGFLLNLSFLRAPSPSVDTFFRNRALRILPMYVPIVIIGGIYRQDIASTIQALFFWNVKISTLWPFGTVWWSLMVEVQFYLLLPCLYWLARSRMQWLIYPLFGAGCFLYLLYTDRLPWHPSRFFFIADVKGSIVCLWPVFFLGGVLAWLHVRYSADIKRYAASSRFFVNGGSDLLLFALLLALGITLRKLAEVGPFAARIYYFDHVLLEALLWASIIGVLLYLPLKTRALWSNAFLNFFGLISYSLYLLHAVFLNLGMTLLAASPIGIGALPKPALIAGLLIAAVALSTLTYALIERPALSWKKRRNTPPARPLENFGASL